MISEASPRSANSTLCEEMRELGEGRLSFWGKVGFCVIRKKKITAEESSMLLTSQILQTLQNKMSPLLKLTTVRYLFLEMSFVMSGFPSHSFRMLWYKILGKHQKLILYPHCTALSIQLLNRQTSYSAECWEFGRDAHKSFLKSPAFWSQGGNQISACF